MSSVSIRFARLLVLVLVFASVLGCPGDDSVGSSSSPGLDGGTDLTGGGDLDGGFQPDGSSTDDAVLHVLAWASACAEESERGSLSVAYSIFADWASESTSTTQVVLTRSYFGCLAAAADCDEYEACSLANEEQASLCGSFPGQQLCDGDVLVFCPFEPEEAAEAFDCTRVGLVCGSSAEFAACGLSLCDPELDPDYCDGRVQMECDSNVYRATDCFDTVSWFCSGGSGCRQSIGGTCQEDPDDPDEVACVGTGDECDLETFENGCEGAVLTSCLHGRVSQFDCTSFDQTCGLDENGHNGCVSPADDCDWDSAESCDSAVITFCANGRVEQLDCSEYGLGSCGTVTSGENAFAHCTL